MATLNLDALPPEVLADLRREAEANGRTVEEQALSRIVHVTWRDTPPPLGEPIPSLEMIAPYHLPLPGPGRPVEVVWRDGPVPAGNRYSESDEERT